MNKTRQRTKKPKTSARVVESDTIAMSKKALMVAGAMHDLGLSRVTGFQCAIADFDHRTSTTLGLVLTLESYRNCANDGALLQYSLVGATPGKFTGDMAEILDDLSEHGLVDLETFGIPDLLMVLEHVPYYVIPGHEHPQTWLPHVREYFERNPGAARAASAIDLSAGAAHARERAVSRDIR